MWIKDVFGILIYFDDVWDLEFVKKYCFAILIKNRTVSATILHKSTHICKHVFERKPILLVTSFALVKWGEVIPRDEVIIYPYTQSTELWRHYRNSRRSLQFWRTSYNCYVCAVSTLFYSVSKFNGRVILIEYIRGRSQGPRSVRTLRRDWWSGVWDSTGFTGQMSGC